MTVTADSFRSQFTAFADQAQFPPADLTYWIGLAYKLHNADRMGDVLDDVVMLYVAHNASLESQARARAVLGADPGAVGGNVTSSSADGVSYSRDVGSGLDPESGNWNLTVYGIRWRALFKMFGAGPVQVGVPSADCGSSPWYGPPMNFW